MHVATGLVVAMLAGLVGCSSLDPIAASHIEGNVPPPEVFGVFLKRDLTADLESRTGHVLEVEYQLLKNTPTQSGTAFPKYFAWVKGREGTVTAIEGAVRVAAIHKDHFEVTAFVTRADVVAHPDALRTVFPEELIGAIQSHAK